MVPAKMMPRIVVADDERDILELIRFVLEFNGFDVVTANNGEEAIQQALAEKPDLVLMDISLPVMDGYEATRIIRKTFPNLPVIGLSAHAMQGDVEKAIAAGCTDYLTKPVDEVLLLNKLKELLG